MYILILSFITAFAIAAFAIPSIIQIAKVKKLIDIPGERRSHTEPTPSLGGIGIFMAVLFSVITWTPVNLFSEMQFILCSMIILFLIGARDDIIPIDAFKKLIAQLVVAIILVTQVGVQIPSLFGIFGIYELPIWGNYALSIFTILVIINAYNLVDGINTLSANLTIIACAFLGTWFFIMNKIGLAVLAFSMIGALVAFLKYNWSPAELFMGDSGSLLCGMVASVLALKFLNMHAEGDIGTYGFKSAPAIAIAVLIVPLFDTLRVFIVRALKGKSPFDPDRRHIHHLLIDSGLSHTAASGILALSNIVFIIIAILFQNIGALNLMFILLGLAMLGTFVSERRANKFRRVQTENLLQKESKR